MNNKLKHCEIEDNYDHLDSDNIEYLLENTLQDDDGTTEFLYLKNEYNSCYTQHCECDCNDCDCCDQNMCYHGGNYIHYACNFNDKKELVLNKNRTTNDLIFECSNLCTCASTLDKCKNRLVQFGPRTNMQIVHLTNKYLGLITTEFIPQGGFICEYVGELLTRTEALKRNRKNEEGHRMNYILCLNERSLTNETSIQTFVDPSTKGNIGRYLNHSCEPNCEILSVRFDHPIPRIGIPLLNY